MPLAIGMLCSTLCVCAAWPAHSIALADYTSWTCQNQEPDQLASASCLSPALFHSIIRVSGPCCLSATLFHSITRVSGPCCLLPSALQTDVRPAPPPCTWALYHCMRGTPQRMHVSINPLHGCVVWSMSMYVRTLTQVDRTLPASVHPALPALRAARGAHVHVSRAKHVACAARAQLGCGVYGAFCSHVSGAACGAAWAEGEKGGTCVCKHKLRRKRVWHPYVCGRACAASLLERRLC